MSASETGVDEPAGAAPVRPSPQEVADLVARLVGSPWPTTEEEREAWFLEHGILTQERVHHREVHHREERGGESWDATVAGPEGWPRIGWSAYEGEFVGVFWFLWHGLSHEVVPGLARELRARLVEIAGEPLDEIAEGQVGQAPDDYRFTAYWQTHGRSIDMYLHGGQVLGNELVEDPVVQLHVDDVDRAARREAAARAAAPEAYPAPAAPSPRAAGSPSAAPPAEDTSAGEPPRV